MKIPRVGVVLVFGCHLFTALARVLAFAVCAVYSGYVLLGISSGHFILSWVFAYFVLRGNGCKSIDSKDASFATLESVVKLFVSLTFSGYMVHSRLGHLLSDSLLYLENVCMLCLWYFSAQSIGTPLYLRYLVSISVLFGYLLGVLLHIVYYVDFHPRNDSIKVWIPIKEWLKYKDQWLKRKNRHSPS